MLLGMLAQTTPQGQAQPFRPGVNQFRAKGVSYRSVLESARVFVRAPPFPGLSFPISIQRGPGEKRDGDLVR
jgi:hypothetical protein